LHHRHAPLIHLEAVEKRYGGRRVLGPITLDVPAGHRIAIVGPSGCGKSTLLRIVLGLVPIDCGSVLVAGQPMRAEAKRAIRRRIGYVVQDGGLFPHLTAQRNVTLMAEYLGWERRRVLGRVDELAAMTGLERDSLARWPLQLSGGQRQRVGVMRALMLDPDVLLLDEPLGALDAITRSRLQTELTSLFRALRKTVIVVTHDIAEAARLADETVVLRDGAIVQRGTLEEMRRAPANGFVAELLGQGAS
jgi:osmoprotectant transport system ATP-binding protein